VIFQKPPVLWRLQLAWKILPPKIWDYTSFIHREYMEQLDSRFFTPLKPEKNFILSWDVWMQQFKLITLCLYHNFNTFLIIIIILYTDM
jgi:hypothetical protein